jgi:hypothetical protein
MGNHLADHPQHLYEEDHMLFSVIGLVEATGDNRVILRYPVKKGTGGSRYPQNRWIRLEQERETAGTYPPEAVSVIDPLGDCIFRPLGLQSIQGYRSVVEEGAHESPQIADCGG